jgi:hypothetical protein
MPAEDRARLAGYLADGMHYMAYLGQSWCRFDCGIDRAHMGSKDLSDGTWVWPEGLSHYVREHNILLPEEFVQEALSKTTPVIPGWVEENVVRGSPKELANDGFWKQWCSPRRSPQFLERLRTTRLAAEALAAADSAADTNKKIAALVHERGLGDANCVWKGCPHKALAGLYICAEHSVKKDSDPQHRMSQEFKRILAELTEANGLPRVGPPAD